jgi:hypothetical protein
MNAQVLIGGDGTGNPDPAAVLELRSSDHGFLPPRVALISTNDPAPLTAFIKGMTVYNTASTGDVTEGTYYCNGYRWNKVRNTHDLIKKSDVSGEVVKLMIDLIQNGGTIINTCPPTVTGNSGTIYTVGDFGVAGCWMIVNSKEGTPSAKQYGKGLEGEWAEGLCGYYYTWEQAQSACPEGYSLPTQAQFSWLRVVLNSEASSFSLWRDGGKGSSDFGGYYDTTSGTWREGGFGFWWTKDKGRFATASGIQMIQDRETYSLWLSVRCIKN